MFDTQQTWSSTQRAVLTFLTSNSNKWHRIVAAMGCFALFCVGATARAGIGPENLIVVVNADSPESRTVANHYVELRKVPSSNVIMLNEIPKEQITTLEAFRERILKPLLAEIDKRGLSNQIRAVAYSSHFPYAVKINEHADRLTDKDMKKMFTATASINGLTYLFRFVLADREEYLSPTANLYSRMPWERSFTQPFAGEDGEQFAQAVAAVDAGEHEKAIEIFLALFKKHPPQAPLGILAARSLVAAGNLDEAMTQLNAAASAGWSSGAALEEDEKLTALAEREDFKKLVERLGDKPISSQHPIAFETARSWTPNGWWTRADLGGMAYLPACMLAVTRGAGTTVDEAVDYLTNAVSADNSFPEGTFYFTATSDVRTKTRAAGTLESIAYLRALGHNAELLKDRIPQKKDDVLGVTFGTAKYDWPASESRFLPGAIGDNLTSTSGAMKGSGQTVLTELLKSGAAIASGTVTEPYALQFKFPLPQIHAYYAEGLTAIEAYYSALGSPYQLLIVGDPLCQPFARQPAEVMSGQLAKVNKVDALVLRTKLPEGTDVKQLDPARTSPISSLEFYIDGKLVHRTRPRDSYTMKLADLTQGGHELRTVLVGEPKTAPRKSIVTWFNVDGLYPKPFVADPSVAGAGEERSITVKASAVGADSITFMYFGEEVGRISGDEGTVSINLKSLGSGPIRLRPIADFRGMEVPGREFVVQQES